MEVAEMLRLLRRQWTVLLPTLLVGLFATALVWVGTPNSYQATTEVLLLNSQNAAQTTGGNPYLVFDSSLGITADVLARSIMSNETDKTLQDEGITDSYEVVLANNSAGPLLTVTVTGGEKASVISTTNRLLRLIATRLSEIQHASGAPPQSRIRATTVTPVQDPKPVLKGKVRSALVVGALGVLLPLLIALLTDAVGDRRRTRRLTDAPQDPWAAIEAFPGFDPDKVRDLPDLRRAERSADLTRAGSGSGEHSRGDDGPGERVFDGSDERVFDDVDDRVFEGSDERVFDGAGDRAGYRHARSGSETRT